MVNRLSAPLGFPSTPKSPQVAAGMRCHMEIVSGLDGISCDDRNRQQPMSASLAHLCFCNPIPLVTTFVPGEELSAFFFYFSDKPGTGCVRHLVLLRCSFRCAQYRHASKLSQGLSAHSLREENCAIILALHNRLKRIPDCVNVMVPVINDNRENVAG